VGAHRRAHGAIGEKEEGERGRKKRETGKKEKRERERDWERERETESLVPIINTIPRFHFFSGMNIDLFFPVAARKGIERGCEGGLSFELSEKNLNSRG
jgi:hypothetical protein